ncbi:MAG: hypothetical protein Q9187_000352 [Circinaria calcarea]
MSTWPIATIPRLIVYSPVPPDYFLQTPLGPADFTRLGELPQLLLQCHINGRPDVSRPSTAVFTQRHLDGRHLSWSREGQEKLGFYACASLGPGGVKGQSGRLDAPVPGIPGETGIPGEMKLVCLGGQEPACAEYCGSTLGWKDLKAVFKNPRNKNPDSRREWYKTIYVGADPKDLEPWKWDTLSVSNGLQILNKKWYSRSTASMIELADIIVQCCVCSSPNAIILTHSYLPLGKINPLLDCTGHQISETVPATSEGCVLKASPRSSRFSITKDAHRNKCWPSKTA